MSLSLEDIKKKLYGEVHAFAVNIQPKMVALDHKWGEPHNAAVPTINQIIIHCHDAIDRLIDAPNYTHQYSGGILIGYHREKGTIRPIMMYVAYDSLVWERWS